MSCTHEMKNRILSKRLSVLPSSKMISVMWFFITVERKITYKFRAVYGSPCAVGGPSTGIQTVADHGPPTDRSTDRTPPQKTFVFFLIIVRMLSGRWQNGRWPEAVWELGEGRGNFETAICHCRRLRRFGWTPSSAHNLLLYANPETFND